MDTPKYMPNYMSNYMLKPYDESYLNVCVDLYMDVFTNEPFNYSWMQRDNMMRYFTDMQNTPCFAGVIVTSECDKENPDKEKPDKEKLIGFCVGAVSDYFGACSYEIKEIMIARGWQRKGIGGKVLRELEEYFAREYGVEAITLLTDKNINAYPFYLKNGYGVSETTVFMSKGTSNAH